MAELSPEFRAALDTIRAHLTSEACDAEIIAHCVAELARQCAADCIAVPRAAYHADLIRFATLAISIHTGEMHEPNLRPDGGVTFEPTGEAVEMEAAAVH